MADFQIYEDQENRVPRGKRDGRVLKANNQEPRAAFRVLGTNNSSNEQSFTNTRIQPSRSAKNAATAKYYQDENAYVTQKSSKSSSSSSSGLSFKIYCDEPSTNSSASSSNRSSASNSLLGNSSIAADSSNGATALNKNSLEFAASKLSEQISLPQCVTELPRSSSALSSNSEQNIDDDVMEVCDNESNVSMRSAVTPGRAQQQQQEHLLKLREDLMYDMSEYAGDIYKYLRETENRHRPRVNYMSKQTDITISMRWILVDWMVEVAEEYNLSTETLYLAVSYIDRFLSHMSVKRDKLQLVGTTAMFIAAKYEEIYPPDVGQFAYITDNTYKVAHILRMEHLILKVLSFDMAVPTAYAFLNMFAKSLGCTEATTSLAQFIAELSMLDCDPFLQYLPSEIAAAALALANYTQGNTAWPTQMTAKFNYTTADIMNCYTDLNTAYSKVNDLAQHAIREKYKAPKFHRVAEIKPRKENNCIRL